MVEFASIIFFVIGIAGCAALFAVKHYEVAHGMVIGGARRAEADVWALKLKQKTFHIREDAEKIPPLLWVLTRWGIHEAALLLARGARTLEKYAHKLADLASHKHHFERTATRSEFLQRMSEYRIGK